MLLTDAQRREFDERGYLFLPELFSAEEIAIMRAELPGINARQGPEIVREKDGKALRTAFAAHTYNDTFAKLARHPRIAEPAQQLLGGDVYIHQFKVNGKAAFDGDVWQWHQDYGVWQRDDDMPEAKGMNLAVFLDEVTPLNGPLLFIPGSHKRGVYEAGHDVETTSYPLWTIDHATIRRLADEGGIVAPTGPAGSGLFFHCNLVHGSPSNMTPWGRTIVYISANRTDNAIRRFKRPEYIAHRDFTAIEPLPDDCLLQTGDAAA